MPITSLTGQPYIRFDTLEDNSFFVMIIYPSKDSETTQAQTDRSWKSKDEIHLFIGQAFLVFC